MSSGNQDSGSFGNWPWESLQSLVAPPAPHCHKPTAVATAWAVLRARAIAHAATLPAAMIAPAEGQVWVSVEGTRVNGYRVLVNHPNEPELRGVDVDCGYLFTGDFTTEHCDGVRWRYVAPDLRTFLASAEGKAWLAGGSK